MTQLRAIVEADLPALERQFLSPDDAGEMNWFGFVRAGSISRRFASGELLREEQGTLAVVEDDGTLVGEVGYFRVMNGPPPNGYAWNVGIWMLPEHRGKGHGANAQRLMAAYLFEHTYLERVEAGTELDNIAEQRALEKAGFTREGVLRHACFRGGEWRDMVVYSKLRGEP